MNSQKKQGSSHIYKFIDPLPTNTLLHPHSSPPCQVRPTASPPTHPNLYPLADVKAQLAAIAARKSGGKTSDPSALQTPSAINARVPTVPDQEDKQKADAKKGKGKGKMSSRQKQRAEKMRQVAVDLGAKIEKKVAAKEGRKVSNRAKRESE